MTGEARRPNVVFVITDQQRADHCGFGGNDIVETPNIDRIGGTVFDRAFVANPICMPNRATILTGRSPSRHGVRFNGISLDPDAATFVRVLREAGYRTGLVGKAHLQNMGHMPGVGAMLFGDRRPEVDRHRPEGWDSYEDLERHRREVVDVPPDFYGFDHVDLAVDHGDGVGGHYHQWLVAQGVDRSTLEGPANATWRYDGWEQVYRTAMPAELYPTTWVTERAIAQLEAAARDGQPFFLHVGYPDPHHPFCAPAPWFDRYGPGDVEVPATFGDPHEASMPHIRGLIERRGRPHPVFTPAMWAPTEDQLRHALAAQYGAIAMIDDGVGAILDALERLGLADDTIVVFTSDHGDMFGDHGLILKAAVHYEATTRVPLAIALPGAPTQRSDALVGSIDLARTILELCGAEPFHAMEGHSLVPLLDDPAGAVRDDLLIEEDEMIDIFGIGTTLRMRTVVAPEGRLTLYAGMEQGELYDHRVDPDELENRWDDPAARDLRAELVERLARRLAAADDEPVPTHFA